MAKTGQDATIYKNNRVILEFSIVDEDASGEPALDVTGYTIKYAIAPFDLNGNPLVNSPVIDESTAGAKVVVTSAVGGLVEVRLGAADTDLLRVADYYHELEVFDASNNPVVAATGTLTVLPNVVNA